ncbi:hypothetical protein U9M48_021784 [Paspalum notatum var. saurae]|uniref:Pectinesterase inhibitor domain-containing protein n=1 Tax=Paspalum notatum var. saurae TaxID=547442 RepID=A0AAQ3TGC5_PASNO
MALLLLIAAATAPGLAAGSSSSVINATCAELSSTQPLDFCLGVLSADQAAAEATDVRAVAAAAVNITAQKANSTLRAIAYLTHDLSGCRGYYSKMTRSLADGLADFRAGRFRDASDEIVVNATNVPLDCSISLFEGNAAKDPIDQENNDNQSLVQLAADIVDLFVKKRLGGDQRVTRVRGN